ncbi:MAG: AIR carboxylase family protein, partial [Chitinophagaceae bacterium]|nr:AIR carboxylase family protein [Chitinophagaceae bacterium]
MKAPVVGIIMGSDSDLPVMQGAADFLLQMQVSFELSVVSAHRTPLRMVDYATTARERGLNRSKPPASARSSVPQGYPGTGQAAP